LKFLTAFAEIGCKVTQNLSLTQIFLRKTIILLHIKGVFVQKIASFLPFLYYKDAKNEEKLHFCWLIEKVSVVLQL
jgi:hypothetical protein